MPAPTRARRARPTRPLSCHNCGQRYQGPDGLLVVESDTDYVKRDGARRVAAHVRCRSCGHSFDSVHPAAVRVARGIQQADAEARG